MEQQQVDLVKGGFRRIMEDRDLFALDFYRELFRLAPELRQQFPVDMGQQRLKLAESIVVIVQHLGDDIRLQDYLSNLGQKHANDFATKPEHYSLFKQALMATLPYQLGDQWTIDTKQAWSAAIDTINEYMTTPREANPL